MWEKHRCAVLLSGDEMERRGREERERRRLEEQKETREEGDKGIRVGELCAGGRRGRSHSRESQIALGKPERWERRKKREREIRERKGQVGSRG